MCISMGVKLPDFISNMPMLYSFCTFPLSQPIVECHEETTPRLLKLGREAAALHHTIHLSMTAAKKSRFC